MRLVSQLRRAGHHGQAKALLREATENGNARARSALACALVYDGRIDEAEALLPVSACDGYDMDLFDLTRDLFNTGRHVEAEAWLRRLIRDGDIWARYLMVRRLDEHGRRSEGEEWLRSIAESGRIEAISELADRLDTEGKADEAELWHRRSASSQHERRHLSAYWLSKRLDSQGRHGEAMDYRQQAFDTVNGDPLALIGFQHWLTERFGAYEVDRVLQSLADLGNWTAALFLAEQLAEHGRYDEAERALRPAAEAGGCLAMGALGKLLRDHSDRHGEAEAWLRRAIEAGGAKTSGVVALAQLQTNEGRRDEASRLQRFGLEPGGTTSDPWSLTRPMDHLSHNTTQP
ncbi:Tetratricopeptide repeat-containing protein [Nonomuraea solani]|uniref:Tetratricopeptide repeat-containing protein n=2 Tax=Nonomuraea solani TaxID=1144553 RepID=A0A1H6F1X6_9ACTN|nr:Tetratricopeptide repeat-containing protein [Nonomuraea solani]